MTANDRQEGGVHYRGSDGAYQHWDFVHESRLDWCGANAIKYVARWWIKNGAADLLKAKHYLQKRQEQGITHPADEAHVAMPYDVQRAVMAKQKWVDGGASVPEYEQGIITQIILGHNDVAAELIQKLIDNESAAQWDRSQTTS